MTKNKISVNLERSLFWRYGTANANSLWISTIDPLISTMKRAMAPQMFAENGAV